MGAKQYGFTAMPAAIDRDVNGVYYIRTVTGFNLYTIADTVGKEVVKLELDDNSIVGDKLVDNAVGLEKVEQVPTYTFLGRKSGGTGNVEKLTVSNVKDMLAIGETQWTNHANGIYYTGNVGLGSIPNNKYRLYIPSEQGKMSHIAHQLTIGGEAGLDTSINTITYDRNQITNAAYRGTVSVDIVNGGNVDTSIGSLNKLFNSNADYLTFSNLTPSSIVTITIEMPENIPHYGLAYWQVFVQNRLNSSGNNTFAESVVVEVFDTVNGEWVSPAGGGWETADYQGNSIRGLWLSEFLYPNAVNINAVRFILSGFYIDIIDSNYYLTQLGLRNYSAPAYPQYFSAMGGNIYGDSVFMGNLSVIKDLKVGGRLRFTDKVSVIDSDVVLDSSHGELIICDASAQITLGFNVNNETPIDRILKIVNKSSTELVKLHDDANSTPIATIGNATTFEIIYISESSSWVKIGEYSNA